MGQEEEDEECQGQNSKEVHEKKNENKEEEQGKVSNEQEFIKHKNKYLQLLDGDESLYIQYGSDNSFTFDCNKQDKGYEEEEDEEREYEEDEKEENADDGKNKEHENDN